MYGVEKLNIHFQKKDFYDNFASREILGKYQKMMVPIKSKENHVENYPVVSNFKYSNRWFDRFCRRNKLSLFES